VTILAAAPSPAQAAQSGIEDLPACWLGGRGRRPSEARRLGQVFAAPQMRQPPQVEAATWIEGAAARGKSGGMVRLVQGTQNANSVMCRRSAASVHART